MNGRASVEQPGALSFDSTQTVRAVTLRELQDPNQQKWFAVQLVVSDRPVNLETMPRLDVFAKYRLYAIRGRLGTKSCHALRLGFFSEHASAQKICEDMQALFRFGSVVQVSSAEQARFDKVLTQEAPASTAAPMGAEVVELHGARRNSTAPSNVPVLTRPIDQRAGDAGAGTSGKVASQPKKPAASTRDRNKFKSLSQELLEEARQIERERIAKDNGKQGAATRSKSWLSRLLGGSRR